MIRTLGTRGTLGATGKPRFAAAAPDRSARSPWIEARARALADERHQAAAARLDRVIGAVSLLTWAVVIGALLITSPATHGAASAPLAAFAVVALALAAAPILLVHLRPGATITRYVAAAAQILGALALLHLGDGRGPAELWILASLALIAAYRDPRVLLWASGVWALDHLASAGSTGALVRLADGWHLAAESVTLAATAAILIVAAALGRRELIALSRQHVELQESQRTRAQSERLAALSHLAATLGAGLHPPVAAIRGAEALLRRRLGEPEGAVDPRARELFDVIERELDGADAVLRDLVDFARGREPVLAPTYLAEVIGEALEIVRGGDPDDDVDVDVRLTAAVAVVEIDRELFRTLLVNLLQNAIEALPAGRRGRIEVRADGGRERWWLTVEDDGVGVPGPAVHRIFEPLFTTKARGAGLGLPVAAEIVRRHGGALRVDRGAAGGARFTGEFRRTIERSE